MIKFTGHFNTKYHIKIPYLLTGYDHFGKKPRVLKLQKQKKKQKNIFFLSNTNMGWKEQIAQVKNDIEGIQSEISKLRSQLSVKKDELKFLKKKMASGSAPPSLGDPVGVLLYFRSFLFILFSLLFSNLFHFIIIIIIHKGFGLHRSLNYDECRPSPPDLRANDLERLLLFDSLKSIKQPIFPSPFLYLDVYLSLFFFFFFFFCFVFFLFCFVLFSSCFEFYFFFFFF